MIKIFLLYSLLIDCCYTRGPHHPRGDVKRRSEQQKHINEHLAFDTQYVLHKLIALATFILNKKIIFFCFMF